MCSQGAQSGALRKLEVWDGGVQEGGAICLLVADSHCPMAEANKIL